MTAAPASVPLSTISTRDRYAGHVNHLNEQQKKALEQFKAALEEKGHYKPASGGADASTDDTTLLRFLRARRFDVTAAVAQFSTSEEWRTRENVPETYDSFDAQEFDDTTLVYPQWTGRRDKMGLPVYLFKVGYLQKDVIAKHNKQADRLDERMFVLYEHMTQFVLPFCSDVPHVHEDTPISATTTIVDISNVSLARFWALRGHMQRPSTLANANYPETLGAIYIVGAPGFFSTVWGWIGKWFDPATVEKIHIIPSHEVTTVLSRFIDPENIPTAYGGTLDFEFSDGKGPNLGPQEKETLGLEELPRGSVKWVKGGFELKGSGRSEEEIKKGTPASKPKSTPAPAPAEETGLEKEFAAHEKVEKPVAPVVDSEKSADGLMPPPITIKEEEKHDITIAAREHPGAPIKDLAATLEGTTL